MKFISAAVAVTTATVMALASGCAARSSGAATTLNAPIAAASTPSGHLGSTLTVQTSGTTLAVTLEAEADPATARPATPPPPGGRLVGFQFTYANLGPAAWSDLGLTGMAAFDAAGNRLTVHLDRGVTADVLNGGVQGMSLPYIQLRKIGWVVVDVPAGDKVSRVQYIAPGAIAMTWGL